MSFPNVYHHRKVANAASRSCEICFKPSTSVLVTPENKDFFYVCPGHLKDRGFCTAIIDQVAVAERRKKEMEMEVERVRKEFEEKQRKKKEKEKGKEKDDTDEKGEKDEKKKKSTEVSVDTTEEEPRVFELKKTFYQSRLERKRNVEIAKRNHERLQNPNLFPSVPQGLP